NMPCASFKRRLKLYPATAMDIGSPSGATCSTLIFSPGIQPISINFNNSSLFSNETISTVLPCLISDSLFITFLLVNKCSIVLVNIFTILEMVRNKGLVKFFILQPFSFNEKRKLKTVIAKLMNEEGKPFESLDYIFCSDEYLLEINQTYLKHDDLTDIITFDLSDTPLIIK